MGDEITLTASDGGRFAAFLALPARLPAPGPIVLPEAFNANPGTEPGFNRQGYPPCNEAAAAEARQRTLAHLHRLLS